MCNIVYIYTCAISIYIYMLQGCVRYIHITYIYIYIYMCAIYIGIRLSHLMLEANDPTRKYIVIMLSPYLGPLLGPIRTTIFIRYTYIYIYMYMHIYIYIYSGYAYTVYIYIYITYIYIYIYIHITYICRYIYIYDMGHIWYRDSFVNLSLGANDPTRNT